MAELDRGFKASDYEDMGTFTLLPAGTYKAAMVGSEWKETKSGNGEYLDCKFQVIDGQYKGTFVSTKLNLHNTNETAVKIARSELATICRAIGIDMPTDSSLLHNKPILIEVAIEPGTNGYKDSNKIKMYRAITGAPVEDAPVFRAADPAAEAGAKKPWEM